MRNILRVILWNKEIGRLAWDAKRRLAYFVYNPETFSTALDIAPLVASVKSSKSHNPIYGEEEKKYQKLPSFIADSLPDDWGNKLFEYWRTQNHISNAEITPLDKLSFIGKRGMGALEFEPDGERTEPNKGKLDVQSLANLAQKIYRQREEIHILPEESFTMQSLIVLGTSAGGRQPKAVIAINKKTKEIRSGQINNLEGFDNYILKFGDKERSSAELEMTYFEMARKAGICISDSELWNVGGVNHFLTKRFDRDEHGKLHTQTLAAMYPEADSYEKLLWVCRNFVFQKTTQKKYSVVWYSMCLQIIQMTTTKIFLSSWTKKDIGDLLQLTI
jgi:serine/threonine-protein kinase HipA